MDPAAFAEDAMAYLPVPPSGQRHRLASATLSFQPGGVPMFANVSAVRAGDADSLTELAARAAEWFASVGRSDFTWFLGPSTTPADAEQVLVAAGATPIATGKAMILTSAPRETAQVEVREVDSAEMLLEFRTIIAPAAGPVTDQARAEIAATNDGAWSDLQAQAGVRRCYLAFDDSGEPVAAGGLLFSERGVAVLAGGATASHARGRGYYRALVRARWAVAAAAGYDTLAVQASADSNPILTRLGFETVADIVILVQRVADGAT